MSDLLTGRSALVTGAAAGIGRAIVERLLAEGASVVGLDVSPAPDDLSHPELRMITGSVTEEADIRGAIAAVTEWRGGLDVMVNDAAIQLEMTIADTSTEDFDRLVAVNLRGTFIGIREAAAAMGERGGSIVNIGSVLGVSGDPLLGAYCATKGGVINLTRSAAVTYGRRGIRINCVCPGAVATPLTTRIWDMADDPAAARREMEKLYPLDRIVEPTEVASAVAFLASDMASGMTGSLVTVDCGLTAANPEYAMMADLV